MYRVDSKCPGQSLYAGTSVPVISGGKQSSLRVYFLELFEDTLPNEMSESAVALTKYVLMQLFVLQS